MALGRYSRNAAPSEINNIVDEEYYTASYFFPALRDFHVGRDGTFDEDYRRPETQFFDFVGFVYE